MHISKVFNSGGRKKAINVDIFIANLFSKEHSTVVRLKILIQNLFLLKLLLFINFISNLIWVSNYIILSSVL